MVLSRGQSSTALASFCVFTKFLRVNFIFIDWFLAARFSAFEIHHNNHEQ